MDFPDHIPDAIKKHATHYIQGNPDLDSKGWLTALKEYAKLKNRSHDKKALDLDRAIIEIKRDLECLKRLIFDERMQEVYERLPKEDKQFPERWDSLILSAWTSNISGEDARDEKRRAKDIQKELSKALDIAYEKLEQLYDTRIVIPPEIVSIPELIESCEHDITDSNYSIWNSMKKYTVEPPEKITNEARNTINYAWEKAPTVSRLIATIASSVESFDFDKIESPFVDFAVHTRQKDPKWEYLRAFLKQLNDKNFTLNASFKEHLVTIAEVVIDNEDKLPTISDINKVLNKL